MRSDLSRHGSGETSRTENSERIERHLEAPISLMIKRTKKEEPKTNNRQCLVFVLGSYRRRWRDVEHPRYAQGKPPSYLRMSPLVRRLAEISCGSPFLPIKKPPHRVVFLLAEGVGLELNTLPNFSHSIPRLNTL